MKHIDREAIVVSLSSRMSYALSFLDFTSTDGDLIHATKPVLGPLVPTIVDAVYDKLLDYDITAASFAPAQVLGQHSVGVSEIHRDHDNIKFRKDFLKGYLIRLASNTDWTAESPFWKYLDGVGKAHTGVRGEDSGLKHRKNKSPLWVEYREVNLLLGWVEVAVIDIVMGVEELDLKTRVGIAKALSKFWWIQNDLFARHYVVDRTLETVEHHGNEKEGPVL
jgi:hypothetical protein